MGQSPREHGLVSPRPSPNRSEIGSGPTPDYPHIEPRPAPDPPQVSPDPSLINSSGSALMPSRPLSELVFSALEDSPHIYHGSAQRPRTELVTGQRMEDIVAPNSQALRRARAQAPGEGETPRNALPLPCLDPGRRHRTRHRGVWTSSSVAASGWTRRRRRPWSRAGGSYVASDWQSSVPALSGTYFHHYSACASSDDSWSAEPRRSGEPDVGHVEAVQGRNPTLLRSAEVLQRRRKLARVKDRGGLQLVCWWR